MSALGTLGTRIGRHAGVYGAGSAVGVAIGLANLVVLTRFLDPTEFGRLALFVAFAGLLTLIYGLVWFKGGIRTVFGGDDDEEDEDEELDESVVIGQARAALGTALGVTALVATLGTVVVALLPGLASPFVGSGASRELVLLAAIAGGVTAVWRLAANVPRRERRSVKFVLLQASLPLLVMAATVPLVAAGGGVRGAVLGLAVGTAAAAVIALVAIKDSWRPVFRIEFLSTIVKRGSTYLPLVISFWVIQHAGVFILARYAPTADVGLLRVATQVSAFGGYAVVAFLRASGPLSREPIHQAARRERGAERMATLMSTYFVLGTIWVVLVFAVAADVLVRVAPPSYAAAAPLIPLIVTGVVLNGWFRVVYRFGRFPNKRRAKISFAVVAGVVFVVVAFALTPGLGAFGVAWAGIAAFAVATAGLLVLAQRSAHPIPIARRRIVAGISLALACYGAAHLLEAVTPVGVAEAFAIVAFPLLLVATSVIPRGHIRPLRDISVAAVPRTGRDGAIDVSGLNRRQRRVLRLLGCKGRPIARVGERLERSEEAVVADFMAALRIVAGLDPKTRRSDPDLAAYLLSTESVADRDALWKRVAAIGVDPFEADTLVVALERVRKVPPETWRPGPG